MEIQVEVTGDDVGELRRRLGDPRAIERALVDMLDTIAETAEHEAEMAAPKGTRRLEHAIGRTRASRQPSGAVMAVVGVGEVHGPDLGALGPLRDKQSAYPFFVHQGTGLFGSKHQVIRPRFARAMRFHGRLGLIVTGSVRGQRPQPYVGRAYEESQAVVPGAVDVAVNRMLGS